MSDEEQLENPNRRFWDNLRERGDSQQTREWQEGNGARRASRKILNITLRHFGRDPEISGVERLIRHIKTHQHQYSNNEGAQFIMALYEGSPETLIHFVARLDKYGYPIEFTPDEQTAFDIAQEKTTYSSRLSQLSHRQTFRDMFTRRQLLKHGGVAMLAIGATAVATSDTMQRAKNSVFDFLGIKSEVTIEEQEEIMKMSGDILRRHINQDGTIDRDNFERDMADSIIGYAESKTNRKLDVDDIATYAGIAATAVLMRFSFMFASNYIVDATDKVDQFINEVDKFCDNRMGRRHHSVAGENRVHSR